MLVRILGAVEVRGHGDGVTPLSPKARRLLAMLAATPGRTVTADSLAEYVMGGISAGSAVRTAVSRLRKVLGHRVVTDGRGYRLALDPRDELDATRSRSSFQRRAP